MLVDNASEKLIISFYKENFYKEQFLAEKNHETLESDVDLIKVEETENDTPPENNKVKVEEQRSMISRRAMPMPIMAKAMLLTDFKASESKLVKGLESIIEEKKNDQINDPPEITDDDLDLKNLESLLSSELKVLKILETRTLDEISSVLEEQSDGDYGVILYMKKRIEAQLDQCKSELSDLERDSKEFVTMTQTISSLKNKLSQFS